MNNLKNTTSALILIFFWLSNNALSADIASDIRRGKSAPDNGDGGYFELGMGLALFESPLIFVEEKKDDTFPISLIIAGEFSYKRFFLEAVATSLDGVNIGYNFYSGNIWALDFLASSFSGVLNEADELGEEGSEAQRRENLKERDTFYSGAGIRATGYYKDFILQYRLVSDVGGNGVTSSARLGWKWLYKNWNFHAIATLGYTSSETNNYLYGITEEEATAEFPAYEADASFWVNGEFGVTYPVSESLVFRSYALLGVFGETVEKSPLLDGNRGYAIITSLSYVF